MSTHLATIEPPLIDQAGQTFALIAEAAKNPAFDAAKFETLVNLHRSECDRQQRTEAYRDLAAFKAICPAINKTKSVNDNSGSRRYKYAPLDELMKQIGGLMREHNLSATFSHEVRENQHFTICRLLHSNGFCFPDSSVQVNRASGNRLVNECQVSGITQSYGERYALKAALGLVFTDEDTDGVDETPPENDVTIDDQIRVLMNRNNVSETDLHAALNAKGIELNGWTWRELDEKIKGRIVSGWNKLTGKGGAA